MMRNAYFGTNALILLGFHVLIFILDLAGMFPYVKTLFFPMFNLILLSLAVLGAVQRDKMKWPSLLALVGGLGMLTYWVVMLVLRLKAG
ncbi:MAG: hypothetical protein AAF570_16840 [Bacteroidota bacterium]